MKPITFPEATAELARPANMTDEECAPLPIFRDNGAYISCWAMTWRERLSALLHGRIWVWVLSGQTQPPIGLEVMLTIFGDRGSKEGPP